MKSSPSHLREETADWLREFGRPASRITLFSLGTPQMRAFHMSWFAFFMCFFAWFGIAPLMVVVRAEFQLTPAQVGNIVIASVAATIVARLCVGWLCDRYGPRRTYAGLLVLGSIPVMAVGLADSYETFLVARLFIGMIGASFVITQYHTSLMFAPNVVGTANATTAGWGNLGGGVTQFAMPLLFAGLVGLGFSESVGWRLSMFIVGLFCAGTGVAYYLVTRDTPRGDLRELRKQADSTEGRRSPRGTFLEACRDRRVWALFVVYAACFGIELTVNNIGALYFADYFALDLATAGAVAASFGLMNIFARTLGGLMGDRFGMRAGLRGRVLWLFVVLLCEGAGLVLLSRMDALIPAIGALLVFSLFVQMSEGATFSVVPFVNRRALGSVAGIVGAGGNAGAVLAGFLFRGGLDWQHALFLLGLGVSVCAFAALTVRFSPEEEAAAAAEASAAARERIPVADESLSPGVSAVAR